MDATQLSNERETFAQLCNPSGSAVTKMNSIIVSTVIYRLITAAEKMKDKTQRCFYTG